MTFFRDFRARVSENESLNSFKVPDEPRMHSAISDTYSSVSMSRIARTLNPLKPENVGLLLTGGLATVTRLDGFTPELMEIAGVLAEYGTKGGAW
jgi:hypothetical protein